MASITNSNQDYDKVKHNAEVEGGEGPKSAVSMEDVEPNPGKQQGADTRLRKMRIRWILQGKMPSTMM